MYVRAAISPGIVHEHVKNKTGIMVDIRLSASISGIRFASIEKLARGKNAHASTMAY